MKKIISVFTIATFMVIPVLSQEEKIEKLENLEGIEQVEESIPGTKAENSVIEDTVILEVGDEIFSVKEMGDETRIRFGKKEFRIVEDNDGVVVFRSSVKDDEKGSSNSKSSKRFKGHLGGIEFGFNGLLTDFFTTSLEPEDSYFDLNSAKSYNWNFTLPSVNIGFTRHFGIAASLGMSFNKYHFDGNNSIYKDENGNIGPSYPEEGVVYSKSKFKTAYATLPIIMEGQIPVSHNNTINVGAGVIGAIKLCSKTKVVSNTDGKQKEKNSDDFSLNLLRWGATGRIGYEFFQVYGTCYFTQLFETGKGPELYPFEVGIAFTFND